MTSSEIPCDPQSDIMGCGTSKKHGMTDSDSNQYFFEKSTDSTHTVLHVSSESTRAKDWPTKDSDSSPEISCMRKRPKKRKGTSKSVRGTKTLPQKMGRSAIDLWSTRPTGPDSENCALLPNSNRLSQSLDLDISFVDDIEISSESPRSQKKMQGQGRSESQQLVFGKTDLWSSPRSKQKAFGDFEFSDPGSMVIHRRHFCDTQSDILNSGSENISKTDLNLNDSLITLTPSEVSKLERESFVSENPENSGLKMDRDTASHNLSSSKVPLASLESLSDEIEEEEERSKGQTLGDDLESRSLSRSSAMNDLSIVPCDRNIVSDTFVAADSQKTMPLSSPVEEIEDKSSDPDLGGVDNIGNVISLSSPHQDSPRAKETSSSLNEKTNHVSQDSNLNQVEDLKNNLSTSYQDYPRTIEKSQQSESPDLNREDLQNDLSSPHSNPTVSPLKDVPTNDSEIPSGCAESNKHCPANSDVSDDISSRSGSVEVSPRSGSDIMVSMHEAKDFTEDVAYNGGILFPISGSKAKSVNAVESSPSATSNSLSQNGDREPDAEEIDTVSMSTGDLKERSSAPRGIEEKVNVKTAEMEIKGNICGSESLYSANAAKTADMEMKGDIFGIESPYHTNAAILKEGEKTQWESAIPVDQNRARLTAECAIGSREPPLPLVGYSQAYFIVDGSPSDNHEIKVERKHTELSTKKVFDLSISPATCIDENLVDSSDSVHHSIVAENRAQSSFDSENLVQDAVDSENFVYNSVDSKSVANNSVNTENCVHDSIGSGNHQDCGTFQVVHVKKPTGSTKSQSDNAITAKKSERAKGLVQSQMIHVKADDLVDASQRLLGETNIENLQSCEGVTFSQSVVIGSDGEARILTLPKGRKERNLLLDTAESNQHQVGGQNISQFHDESHEINQCEGHDMNQFQGEGPEMNQSQTEGHDMNQFQGEDYETDIENNIPGRECGTFQVNSSSDQNMLNLTESCKDDSTMNKLNIDNTGEFSQSNRSIDKITRGNLLPELVLAEKCDDGAVCGKSENDNIKECETFGTQNIPSSDLKNTSISPNHIRNEHSVLDDHEGMNIESSQLSIEDIHEQSSLASASVKCTDVINDKPDNTLGVDQRICHETCSDSRKQPNSPDSCGNSDVKSSTERYQEIAVHGQSVGETSTHSSHSTGTAIYQPETDHNSEIPLGDEISTHSAHSTSTQNSPPEMVQDSDIPLGDETEHAFNMDSSREISQSNQSHADDTESQKPLGTDIETKDSLIGHNQPNSAGHAIKQFSSELGTEKQHIQNCHKGPLLDSVEHKTIEHCDIINGQQSTLCTDIIQNVAGSVGNASSEILAENSHIAHLHTETDEGSAKSPSSMTDSELSDINEPQTSETVAELESLRTNRNGLVSEMDADVLTFAKVGEVEVLGAKNEQSPVFTSDTNPSAMRDNSDCEIAQTMDSLSNAETNPEVSKIGFERNNDIDSASSNLLDALSGTTSSIPEHSPVSTSLQNISDFSDDPSHIPEHSPESTSLKNTSNSSDDQSGISEAVLPPSVLSSSSSESSDQKSRMVVLPQPWKDVPVVKAGSSPGSDGVSITVNMSSPASLQSDITQELLDIEEVLTVEISHWPDSVEADAREDLCANDAVAALDDNDDDKEDDNEDDDLRSPWQGVKKRHQDPTQDAFSDVPSSLDVNIEDLPPTDPQFSEFTKTGQSASTSLSGHLQDCQDATMSSTATETDNKVNSQRGSIQKNPQQQKGEGVTASHYEHCETHDAPDIGLRVSRTVGGATSEPDLKHLTNIIQDDGKLLYEMYEEKNVKNLHSPETDTNPQQDETHQQQGSFSEDSVHTGEVNVLNTEVYDTTENAAISLGSENDEAYYSHPADDDDLTSFHDANLTILGAVEGGEESLASPMSSPLKVKALLRAQLQRARKILREDEDAHAFSMNGTKDPRKNDDDDDFSMNGAQDPRNDDNDDHFSMNGTKDQMNADQGNSPFRHIDALKENRAQPFPGDDLLDAINISAGGEAMAQADSNLDYSSSSCVSSTQGSPLRMVTQTDPPVAKVLPVSKPRETHPKEGDLMLIIEELTKERNLLQCGGDNEASKSPNPLDRNQDGALENRPVQVLLSQSGGEHDPKIEKKSEVTVNSKQLIDKGAGVTISNTEKESDDKYVKGIVKDTEKLSTEDVSTSMRGDPITKDTEELSVKEVSTSMNIKDTKFTDAGALGLTDSKPLQVLSNKPGSLKPNMKLTENIHPTEFSSELDPCSIKDTKFTDAGAPGLRDSHPLQVISNKPGSLKPNMNLSVNVHPTQSSSEPDVSSASRIAPKAGSPPSSWVKQRMNIPMTTTDEEALRDTLRKHLEQRIVKLEKSLSDSAISSDCTDAESTTVSPRSSRLYDSTKLVFEKSGSPPPLDKDSSARFVEVYQSMNVPSEIDIKTQEIQKVDDCALNSDESDESILSTKQAFKDSGNVYDELDVVGEVPDAVKRRNPPTAASKPASLFLKKRRKSLMEELLFHSGSEEDLSPSTPDVFSPCEDILSLSGHATWASLAKATNPDTIIKGKKKAPKSTAHDSGLSPTISEDGDDISSGSWHKDIQEILEDSGEIPEDDIFTGSPEIINDSQGAHSVNAEEGFVGKAVSDGIPFVSSSTKQDLQNKTLDVDSKEYEIESEELNKPSNGSDADTESYTTTGIDRADNMIATSTTTTTSTTIVEEDPAYLTCGDTSNTRNQQNQQDSLLVEEPLNISGQAETGDNIPPNKDDAVKSNHSVVSRPCVLDIQPFASSSDFGVHEEINGSDSVLSVGVDPPALSVVSMHPIDQAVENYDDSLATELMEGEDLTFAETSKTSDRHQDGHSKLPDQSRISKESSTADLEQNQGISSPSVEKEKSATTQNINNNVAIDSPERLEQSPERPEQISVEGNGSAKGTSDALVMSQMADLKQRLHAKGFTGPVLPLSVGQIKAQRSQATRKSPSPPTLTGVLSLSVPPSLHEITSLTTSQVPDEEFDEVSPRTTIDVVDNDETDENSISVSVTPDRFGNKMLTKVPSVSALEGMVQEPVEVDWGRSWSVDHLDEFDSLYGRAASTDSITYVFMSRSHSLDHVLDERSESPRPRFASESSRERRQSFPSEECSNDDLYRYGGCLSSSSSGERLTSEDGLLSSTGDRGTTSSIMSSEEPQSEEDQENTVLVEEVLARLHGGPQTKGEDDERVISEDDDTDDLLATPRVFVDVDSLDTNIGTSGADLCPESPTTNTIETSTEDKGLDIMPGVMLPSVDVISSANQPTAANGMPYVHQPTKGEEMVSAVPQTTTEGMVPNTEQPTAEVTSNVKQPTVADVVSGVQQPTTADVMPGVQQPTVAGVMSGVQQPTTSDVMPGVQQPTTSDVMSGVQQPTTADVTSGVQQPTVADVMPGVQQPTTVDVMPGVQQTTAADVTSGVQQATAADVMPGVQQPTTADVMSCVQQPTTADVMPGVQQPTVADVMPGVQQPTTADVMPGVQQPTTADVMSCVQQPTTADVMPGVQQPTVADVMPGVQQPTTADVMPGVQQPTTAEVMSCVQQPTTADVMPGVQQPTVADVMPGVQQPTTADVMPGVQQPTVAVMMSGVQQPTVADVTPGVQQQTVTDVMSGVQQPTAADVMSGVQQPTAAHLVSGLQRPTTADVMAGVQQPTTADVTSGVQQATVADVMSGVQQPTAADLVPGLQQPTTADVMSGVQQPTVADVVSGVQQPTAADVMSGVQQPTTADVMSGVQQPTTADVMSGVLQPTTTDVMPGVQQPTTADVMSGVQQPTVADVVSGVQQPTAADVMPDVQQPTTADVMSGVQQPSTADVMSGVQQPTTAVMISGVQQPTTADAMSGVQQPTAADLVPGLQRPTTADVMAGVQQPTTADVTSGVQQATVADVMSGVQQPTAADLVPGLQQPTVPDVVSGLQQPTTADVMSGVQQPTTADVVSGVQQPTVADVMSGVQQPTAADVVSGVQQPTVTDVMAGVQQPTAADVMSGVQQPTAADVMPGVQQPTVADVMAGVQQPTVADVMPGVQQPTAADVMPDVQQPTAADVMPGVQQPTEADVMPGVQQPTAADVMPDVQQPTAADVMPGVQQPTEADVMAGVQQPTVADVMPDVQQPTAADVMSDVPQPTAADVMPGVQQPTTVDMMSSVQQPTTADVMPGDQQPTTAYMMSSVQQSTTADVMPGVQQPTAADVMPGVQQPTVADVTPGVQQPTAADVMPGVQQPTVADVMPDVQQPTAVDVMPGVQQPTVADVMAGVQQPTSVLQPTAAYVMSGVQQPSTTDVMADVPQPTAADGMPGVQQPTVADVMPDVQQPTAADVMSGVQQPTVADVMPDVQQPTAADVMSGVRQPTVADVMSGVPQPTAADVMPDVQQPTVADVMPDVQQPTVADVMAGIQQPTAADVMSGVQQPTAAERMSGVRHQTTADVMPGVRHPTTADVMPGVQQPTAADVIPCDQQPTIADVMSGVQRPTATDVMYGVQQPTVADVMAGVQQPTTTDVMPDVQQPTVTDVMSDVHQPTTADAMSGVQQPTAADVMPDVYQTTTADAMSRVQQPTTADAMSGVQQPTAADVMPDVHQPTTADAMSGVQQPTAADVMPDVYQPTTADAMSGVQQPTAADVMPDVHQPTTADAMSGVQQPTAADAMSGVQQPTAADVMPDVYQPTTADVMSGVHQPFTADAMSGVQQPTAADVMPGVQQPTEADVMAGVQQPTVADVMPDVHQPFTADVMSGVQQRTTADAMFGVQQPTVADALSGVQQPTTVDVMPDVHQPTVADMMSGVQQPTTPDAMSVVQQPTAADVMPGVQQPTTADVMSGVQQPTAADVSPGVQQPTTADVVSGVQQPTAADVVSGVQQPTVADVMPDVQQPTTAYAMSGVQQPTTSDVVSGVQQPTVADVVSGDQQPTTADVVSGVQQPTAADVMPGDQQPTAADVVSGVQQPAAADVMPGDHQPTAADVMPGVQQPTTADVMSSVQQPTTADVMSGVLQPTTADVMSGVLQPTAADVMSGVHQPTAADVMPGAQQPTTADVMSGVQRPTTAVMMSAVQQPTAADVMSGVQQPTAADVTPGVQQPTAADVMPGVQQPTTADVMSGVQRPTTAVMMSAVQQPTAADVTPGVQQPTAADVMPGDQQPTAADVMSGVQQPTTADVMPGVQQPTRSNVMSGVQQPTAADITEYTTESDIQFTRPTEKSTVADAMSGVQQPTEADVIAFDQQPTAADITEYTTEYDVQPTRPAQEPSGAIEDIQSDIQQARPTEESTGVTEYSTESDVQHSRHREESTGVTEYSTESDVKSTRPREESIGVTEYSTESDVQPTGSTEVSTSVTKYSTESDVQPTRPTEKSTGVTKYFTEPDIQSTRPTEKYTDVTEYSTESDVQANMPTEESTGVTESDVQPTRHTEESTGLTEYSIDYDVQPTVPKEQCTGVTEYSTESDMQSTRPTEKSTVVTEYSTEYDVQPTRPIEKSTGVTEYSTEPDLQSTRPTEKSTVVTEYSTEYDVQPTRPIEKSTGVTEYYTEPDLQCTRSTEESTGVTEYSTESDVQQARPTEESIGVTDYSTKSDVQPTRPKDESTRVTDYSTEFDVQPTGCTEESTSVTKYSTESDVQPTRPTEKSTGVTEYSTESDVQPTRSAEKSTGVTEYSTESDVQHTRPTEKSTGVTEYSTESEVQPTRSTEELADLQAKPATIQHHSAQELDAWKASTLTKSTGLRGTACSVVKGLEDKENSPKSADAGTQTVCSLELSTQTSTSLSELNGTCEIEDHADLSAGKDQMQKASPRTSRPTEISTQTEQSLMSVTSQSNEYEDDLFAGKDQIQKASPGRCCPTEISTQTEDSLMPVTYQSYKYEDGLFAGKDQIQKASPGRNCPTEISTQTEDSLIPVTYQSVKLENDTNLSSDIHSSEDDPSSETLSSQTHDDLEYSTGHHAKASDSLNSLGTRTGGKSASPEFNAANTESPFRPNSHLDVENDPALASQIQLISQGVGTDRTQGLEFSTQTGSSLSDIRSSGAQTQTDTPPALSPREYKEMEIQTSAWNLTSSAQTSTQTESTITVTEAPLPMAANVSSQTGSSLWDLSSLEVGERRSETTEVPGTDTRGQTDRNMVADSPFSSAGDLREKGRLPKLQEDYFDLPPPGVMMSTPDLDSLRREHQRMMELLNRPRQQRSLWKTRKDFVHSLPTSTRSLPGTSAGHRHGPFNPCSQEHSISDTTQSYVTPDEEYGPETTSNSYATASASSLPDLPPDGEKTPVVSRTSSVKSLISASTETVTDPDDILSMAEYEGKEHIFLREDHSEIGSGATQDESFATMMAPDYHIDASTAKEPLRSQGEFVLETSTEIPSLSEEPQRFPREFVSEKSTEIRYDPSPSEEPLRSQRESIQEASPKSHSDPSIPNVTGCADDNSFEKDLNDEHDLSNPIMPQGSHQGVGCITESAILYGISPEAPSDLSRDTSCVPQSQVGDSNEGNVQQVLPQKLDPEIQPSNTVSDIPALSPVKSNDLSAEVLVEDETAEDDFDIQELKLEELDTSDLVDTGTERDLSNIRDTENLSNIQDVSDLSEIQNSGYQNNETIEQDFDCDAWKEEESKNDGGEIGGTRTSTVSSGIQTEFLPDERRTSSRLSSHISTQYDSYNTDDSTQTDNFEGSVKSVDTRDESIETDDTQELSDELAKLRQEREQVIGLLAKDIVPSKFQIEMAEAQLNYIIGQTDTLLQAFDTPWEMEDVKTVFGKPEKFLSDIGHEYLAKYRNELEESKKRLEDRIGLLEKEKELRLTARQSRSRNKELNKWRRKAEVDAFKLERERENLNFQRTMSMSPRRRDSSDFVSPVSSRDSSLNDESSSRLTSPKQMNKHLIGMRKKLLAVSKKEEEAAKLHYSHSPSKNPHSHTRSLGSSSSSNKLKGYQATNLDSYRFYNPYDYRPLADLGLGHMQETAVDESVSDRMSTTSSLTEESEELLEEYRRTRSQTRSEIAKARENLDKPPRETHRNGIYSRGPASER